MSQRNYLCDLVKCANWDSIENGNEETFIDRWRIECKECKHSNSILKGNKCNYKPRRE